METIRINRLNLLEKLKENRAKHEVDFNEALKSWKKKATKALVKASDKATDEGWITLNPLEKLPKPESYLTSYDDAIARVEVDTRNELELNDREFSAWFQDKWIWRDQFAANTSLYNGGF